MGCQTIRGEEMKMKSRGDGRRGRGGEGRGEDSKMILS